jgi:hypothetical protein
MEFTAIDLEALQRRVAGLERQNRWMKRGGYAIVLVFASLFVIGRLRPPLRTLEAQRFVLRSAKGEVRAELTTLDGDYPRLRLQSPNGEKETELSPLGVSVSDHGLSGKLPLAHLGNLGIYFTDTQGRTVMELGGAGANIHTQQLAPVPEITIFDEKGKSIWHAPN